MDHIIEKVWAKEENKDKQHLFDTTILHFSESSDLNEAKKEWYCCDVSSKRVETLNTKCICSNKLGEDRCTTMMYIQNKLNGTVLAISVSCYNGNIGYLHWDEDKEKNDDWSWDWFKKVFNFHN